MSKTIAVASPSVIFPAKGVRNKFLAVIRNRDLIVVTIFSVVGLLLAIYIPLRFPDLGALTAQYNQF